MREQGRYLGRSERPLREVTLQWTGTRMNLFSRLPWIQNLRGHKLRDQDKKYFNVSFKTQSLRASLPSCLHLLEASYLNKSVSCLSNKKKNKKTKNLTAWECPGRLAVKDPLLSLLWHLFSPWPRNFYMPLAHVAQKKKKKTKPC